MKNTDKMHRVLFARVPVTSLKVSRKTPSLRQIREVGSNNFDNLGGVRLTPLPDSGAFRHFLPCLLLSALSNYGSAWQKQETNKCRVWCNNSPLIDYTF